jgi:hypothetical protein
LIYNEKEKLKIVKEKSVYYKLQYLNINRVNNFLEMREFFIHRRFQYDMDIRTRTEKIINPSFNVLEFD